MIAEFINDMEKILPTKFGIVHGNHDRLSPDKKDNAYNDSVSYVILDTLLMLQDVGQFKNTEIIDNRENQGSFTDKVNGKNIMVLHGDKGLTSGKAGKIPQLIRDEIIDLLFTGHFHSVAMEQEDYDRLWIQVSSISGYNTYSKDLNLPYTKPSQTLIVLHEELRGPFIYPVFFD